jgi:anthranilate synthase component 1
MAGQGNLLPVYQEFLADMETPVSTYLKIRDKAFSYLLESAEGGTRWGRYSFIGYKPYVTALSRGREMEIKWGNRKETVKDVPNPLGVLRELSRKFQLVEMKDGSPSQGGLVGYCNYDLVDKWERIPRLLSKDDHMPQCLFTASKRLIIFDHLTHKIRAVALAHLTGREDLKEAYATACEEVDEIVSELKTPFFILPEGMNFQYLVSSPMSKERNSKKLSKGPRII